MKTGIEYAKEAEKSKYDSLKYSQVDCQAFCELVLKNIGVRQANGKVYDWRGSNDMFRNAVSWRGTLAECRKKYGCIPPGSWAFMVAHDGGEVARGYHDELGNAAHGAIVVNENQVRDSTKGSKRDGVAYRTITDFNYIGIPKMLDFGGITHNIIEIDTDELNSVLNSLNQINNIMKGWLAK